MAKFEIEIPDGLLPDGVVPIGYRRPVVGEMIYIDVGVKSADAGHVYPRLIVREKEAEKKVRPYNAEEMKRLYIERARLVCGSESHDVTGHDGTTNRIKLDGVWLNELHLRALWKHLDGSRCEVVE